MKKKDTICRIPPCPSWDIPAMEAWLEDMARAGYILDYPRHRNMTLQFHRAAPQTVRYRMEPSPKAQWAELAEPEEAQRQLYLELGWESVCFFGGCFIYRCTDPDASELNTDPVIQSLALKKWKRRSAFGLLMPIGLLIPILIALYYGVLLISILQMGSRFTLFIVAAIYLAVREVRMQLRLSKMICALRDGKPLPKSDWKKTAAVHRFINITALVLGWAIWFSAMGLRTAELFDFGKVSLEDWTEPVPFVTLQEMDPQVLGDDFDRIVNPEGKKWFSILSPVNYEWIDGGTLQVGGWETRFSTPLHVNYHETIAPVIARQLVKEYQGRYRIAYQMKDENWHEVDLGIDYATGYYPRDGEMRFIILCHGNTVIWAECGVNDPEGMLTTENWARLMAQRLLENE